MSIFSRKSSDSTSSGNNFLTHPNDVALANPNPPLQYQTADLNMPHPETAAQTVADQTQPLMDGGASTPPISSPVSGDHIDPIGIADPTAKSNVETVTATPAIEPKVTLPTSPMAAGDGPAGSTIEGALTDTPRQAAQVAELPKTLTDPNNPPATYFAGTGPNDPVSPPAYTGGAPAVDVEHPQPGITITTTNTGAKVEQAAGGTPYRISSPTMPNPETAAQAQPLMGGGASTEPLTLQKDVMGNPANTDTSSPQGVMGSAPSLPTNTGAGTSPVSGDYIDPVGVALPPIMPTSSTTPPMSELSGLSAVNEFGTANQGGHGQIGPN